MCGGDGSSVSSTTEKFTSDGFHRVLTFSLFAVQGLRWSSSEVLLMKLLTLQSCIIVVILFLSGKRVDRCGICDGDGSSCKPCGTSKNGLPLVRYRCTNREWNINDLPQYKDVCGVCGGDGKSCIGCDLVPYSGLVSDGKTAFLRFCNEYKDGSDNGSLHTYVFEVTLLASLD